MMVQQPQPGQQMMMVQQPQPGQQPMMVQQPQPGQQMMMVQQPQPGQQMMMVQQPQPGQQMMMVQQPLQGQQPMMLPSQPGQHQQLPFTVQQQPGMVHQQPMMIQYQAGGPQQPMVLQQQPVLGQPMVQLQQPGSFPQQKLASQAQEPNPPLDEAVNMDGNLQADRWGEGLVASQPSWGLGSAILRAVVPGGRTIARVATPRKTKGTKSSVAARSLDFDDSIRGRPCALNRPLQPFVDAYFPPYRSSLGEGRQDEDARYKGDVIWYGV